MAQQKFYLGWRSNPQLSKGGYYKKYGQMTMKQAKNLEKCLYGGMYLTAYDTEAEYLAEIEKIQEKGYRIF